MNSKGITPIADDVCFICQKEIATMEYHISHREYGSAFDSDDITFRCCEHCNKPEFKEWFNEAPEEDEDGFCENYIFEDNLINLFKSLLLNSQERIYNGCSGWSIEPQDWIDYQLDELPHEKCKECNLYSPEEIQAYHDRFPICDKVFKKVYSDGSSTCSCDYGARGESDGSCCSNTYAECYMCSCFEIRDGDMEEISISQEMFERENQRLIEMLVYSVNHLKELGIDITQYIDK